MLTPRNNLGGIVLMPRNGLNVGPSFSGVLNKNKELLVILGLLF
jgi:hypothetical protein